MAVARSLVVERGVEGIYHCISRCVRRAFLCGDGFDHRRDWIQERMRELAGIFALDVCGYAVLGNHFHVVLRMSPARAAQWSSEEVAGRWLRLFPPPAQFDDAGGKALAEAIGRLAADERRIGVLRQRLADLSWFMRCLNEWIARRANREDQCTGRFWEGRFKCHRLLDDAAILGCMVYVDLNLIRAGLAKTPERSDHTSVQDRIRARRHIRQLRVHGKHATRGGRAGSSALSRSLLPGLAPGRVPRHDEEGIWLAPIERSPEGCVEESGGSERGLLPLTLDQYLELVDVTGRFVRGGKGGTIPEHLQGILARLDLDETVWCRCINRVGKMIGTVIGTATSRAREAARRQRRWVVGAMTL